MTAAHKSDNVWDGSSFGLGSTLDQSPNRAATPSTYSEPMSAVQLPILSDDSDEDSHANGSSLFPRIGSAAPGSNDSQESISGAGEFESGNGSVLGDTQASGDTSFSNASSAGQRLLPPPPDRRKELGIKYLSKDKYFADAFTILASHYDPNRDPNISNTALHASIANQMVAMKRYGTDKELKAQLLRALPPVILAVNSDLALADWNESVYASEQALDANVHKFMKNRQPETFREAHIVLELIIAILLGPIGDAFGKPATKESPTLQDEAAEACLRYIAEQIADVLPNISQFECVSIVSGEESQSAPKKVKLSATAATAVAPKSISEFNFLVERLLEKQTKMGCRIIGRGLVKEVKDHGWTKDGQKNVLRYSEVRTTLDWSNPAVVRLAAIMALALNRRSGPPNKNPVILPAHYQRSAAGLASVASGGGISELATAEPTDLPAASTSSAEISEVDLRKLYQVMGVVSDEAAIQGFYEAAYIEHLANSKKTVSVDDEEILGLRKNIVAEKKAKGRAGSTSDSGSGSGVPSRSSSGSERSTSSVSLNSVTPPSTNQSSSTTEPAVQAPPPRMFPDCTQLIYDYIQTGDVVDYIVPRWALATFKAEAENRDNHGGSFVVLSGIAVIDPEIACFYDNLTPQANPVKHGWPSEFGLAQFSYVRRLQVDRWIANIAWSEEGDRVWDAAYRVRVCLAAVQTSVPDVQPLLDV